MTIPSFLEVQFPPRISYGLQGGPSFRTTLHVASSGREKRNVDWSVARSMWDASKGLQTQTELDVLLSFFRVVRGRAVGFRWKDWMDYTVTAQAIGTGDGVEDDFQIIKAYTVGSESYTRTINKPVTASVVSALNVALANTVSVWVDGVLQTLTTDYTVSHTTGVIHFVVPPPVGDVITVTCEFDVPVRFDTDEIRTSMERFNDAAWEQIPIVELKLD